MFLSCLSQIILFDVLCAFILNILVYTFQETFWRIPTDLSAEDLTLISQSLEINDEEKFACLDKLTSFLQTKMKTMTIESSKGNKSEKKQKQKATKTSQKTPKLMDKTKPKRYFVSRYLFSWPWVNYTCIGC